MLTGYRILDLTDEKGILCPKLLSDMGGEVIRIEKPGCNAAETHNGYRNAGKHLISLDIETIKGSELFKRLIKTADVVVESFSPGYLGSLGLDYPAIHSVNPVLIMASITFFGQTGPYRDYKSSEIVSSALGGQMYVCGKPGNSPLRPFGPQAYSTASLFAANGILLALLQRHSSNRGRYIDISIHECVAGTLDHVLVRYFYQDAVAERRGSLYWNNAFRIFSCQDGYILLSLFQQWETLAEWLDSEGMADDLTDRKWLDESKRQTNLDHIIGVLGKWTQTHTVHELLEQGQLMHFPWAEVSAISQVVNSPQLNERGFFVEALDPQSGKPHKYPGAPVKMSGSPWQVHTELPVAGEYNLKIYRDEMDLNDAEVTKLEGEGVI